VAPADVYYGRREEILLFVFSESGTVEVGQLSYRF
jgi:hypothetical protein